MKRSIGFVLLAFVIVSGSAASGSATEAQEPQTNRYLGDRWNVTIQGVVGELSSDVSAGRQLGALIDLEELLGFEAIDSNLYYISKLPSDVQLKDVTIIAIFAFLITVAFAMIPASRAARVQPAEALRYE